ncbi:MAG: BON domain-containing protein [Blastocatellales bacterium]
MKRIVFTPILLLSVMIGVSSSAIAIESFGPQKKKSAGVEEQSSQAQRDARNVAYLVKEVRKELVTIPFFGVFDWLEGYVESDGTVRLKGEVTRPIIKSDAENRVEKIEGVTKVINEIEVLPLSNQDDRLRLAVYRTLYNFNSPLFRYGQQPIPSIHIIINNGRLTLKGVVNSKADSDIARVKAGGVPGLFEVKNELQIESSKKK